MGIGREHAHVVIALGDKFCASGGAAVLISGCLVGVWITVRFRVSRNES